MNEILENTDLNFIEKSLYAAWQAGHNVKDWIQNQTTRAKYRKSLKEKAGIDIYCKRDAPIEQNYLKRELT
ncbi:MAG: hypothetical protein QJT81_12370 [Candidatus Thiothrix putei]|uniref:Uncharacterized protein n=2 Tax=Thiothrix TaxID=1030 RepID=A0A1H4GYD4_9GAMM|nr:hypothetical protein [Thiothrix caldifontis]WGZ92660.1 MAG: hypothetical protein QJT81_12370 [Candidatus Thiothrix putei]SEB14585.1 hypothetical protein SAMN05660964_03811 [Thiothrix caldifontis]